MKSVGPICFWHPILILAEAMSRLILQLDRDAFLASAGQSDDPKLRGEPVIVGAPPTQRGVV